MDRKAPGGTPGPRFPPTEDTQMKKRCTRTIAALAALILVLSLISCTGKPAGSENPATPTEVTPTEVTPTPTPTPETPTPTPTPETPTPTPSTPTPTPTPTTPTPTPTPTTPTPTTPSIPDEGEELLERLIRYVETGDKSFIDPQALTGEEKEELTREAENAGGTIQFLQDGTISITGENDSYIMIYPDGSAAGVDVNGDPFGYSYENEWPDGTLGNAVPKNDFTIKRSVSDNEDVMIFFENVAFEQAEAYGRALEEAGFTVDAVKLSHAQNNVYSYYASNAGGISVEFVYRLMEEELYCTLLISSGEAQPDPGPGPHPGFDWPAEGALARVPVVSFGADLMIFEDDDYVTATVFDATEADFEAYNQKLTDAGYNYVMTLDDGTHAFQNDDGFVALTQYKDGAFGVMASKDPQA